MARAMYFVRQVYLAAGQAMAVDSRIYRVFSPRRSPEMSNINADREPAAGRVVIGPPAPAHRAGRSTVDAAQQVRHLVVTSEGRADSGQLLEFAACPCGVAG